MENISYQIDIFTPTISCSRGAIFFSSSNSNSHHLDSSNFFMMSSSNLYLSILAGFPATIAYGGVVALKSRH